MGCLSYDLFPKFISWLIVIIYTSIIGILFLVKMSKAKEIKSQKEMFRSIAIFLFLFMGLRVFFLLSDFERDANCESILYFQYVFMGYVCSVSAFLSLLMFGEKYLIKGTKHVPTIIILIGVVIDLIMVFTFPLIVNTIASNSPSTPIEDVIKNVGTLVRYFNYFINYMSIGIILILYLYLIAKSTGGLRRNSIITVIGLAISSLSALLESDAILSSGLIPPYISPVLFALGITIFAFAYLKAEI